MIVVPAGADGGGDGDRAGDGERAASLADDGDADGIYRSGTSCSAVRSSRSSSPRSVSMTMARRTWPKTGPLRARPTLRLPEHGRHHDPRLAPWGICPRLGKTRVLSHPDSGRLIRGSSEAPGPVARPGTSPASAWRSLRRVDDPVKELERCTGRNSDTHEPSSPSAVATALIVSRRIL